MSNAARTLAPSLPLVHLAPPIELASELDDWLANTDDAHPQDCGCESCVHAGLPELAQTVLHHQPAIERACNRLLLLPVELRRSYRTDAEGQTVVTLELGCDIQADQLTFDERRILIEAVEWLRYLGFHASSAGVHPPRVRITGYFGTKLADLRLHQLMAHAEAAATAAAPETPIATVERFALPALAKTAPAAAPAAGEERAA